MFLLGKGALSPDVWVSAERGARQTAQPKVEWERRKIRLVTGRLSPRVRLNLTSQYPLPLIPTERLAGWHCQAIGLFWIDR